MTQLAANSLISLAKNLHSGDLTPLTYLSTLETQFNARDPVIHAFVPEESRFERLRQDAKALICYAQPEVRPPLFGIPVGVKDIFHVDGLVTRAGSQLPPDELMGEEADCVTILKKIGALIMGKTVTTEFAYLAPGPTRNPHNPEHSPGGSSSGSAAAVASGLCPVALGTQTVGSIIRPASFCGVVGYKPSYDRISRVGIIPLSPSLDHVGFFTSDAKGANLVASLLCPNWQTKVPNHKPALGVPEGPYLGYTTEEGLIHFRATVKWLAKAGFEVESIDAMPDFNEIAAQNSLIMAAEMAQVHAEWFTKYGELYHPITREMIKRGKSISDDLLTNALSGREELRANLIELMEKNSIDLWLSPAATGPAPKGLGSTGNPIMNLPWTHGGLPTLNLPSGFSQNGLPLGLQITGGWYADEELLAWAVSIEENLKLNL